MRKIVNMEDATGLHGQGGKVNRTNQNRVSDRHNRFVVESEAL